MILDFRLAAGVMLLGFSVTGGCTGRPSRLAAPGIDRRAADAAISKYDADRDGAIGGAELDKVPALKKSLKRVDTNGDSKVTADEIDGRIAAWAKSGLAITKIVATVRQNQQPVADAQITLVPEDFLGASVKPAQGTTDARGMTHLAISSSPDEAGVHLGFFRIQVSKKKADGTETIAARYNTETELGVEITPEDPNSDRLTVDLTSR